MSVPARKPDLDLRRSEVQRLSGDELVGYLQKLQGGDSSLQWETVAQLAYVVPFYLPSPEAVSFVVAIVGSTDGQRVLDPCSDYGVLLAALAGSGEPASLDGTILESRLLAVAEALAPSATWTHAEPVARVAELASSGRRFDLVVGVPRLGERRAPGPKGDPMAGLTTDQRLVITGGMLLSDSGRAFFIVPDSFLLSVGEKARTHLTADGLHVWSVISLPASWYPGASVRVSLLEVRPVKPIELFIGAALADSDNAGLVVNHAARQGGRVPESGVLVDPAELSTWEEYADGLAFERAASTLGGAVIDLSTIVLRQSLGSRKADGGFIDEDNALFLPLIGNSAATTRRSSLSMKAHNYVQLVLDPERADAEYLASYFNTPIGLLSRRTMQVGATIRKASLRTIGNAAVVLPDLDQQQEVMRLQRRLEEVRAEVDTAEHDLWRRADGARTTARIIRAFPKNDLVDRWLPELPYPLASILWTYQAASDTRRRIEILFAFFEATAQFVSTILLSGVRADPVLYSDVAEALRDHDGSSHWRRSSLGSWIVTGRTLAKSVRRSLAGDQRRNCLDAFGCSGGWLDGMAGKQLFNVLERTGELRNAWKGHGGVESDAEAGRRLERMQSELAALLLPLSDAFDDLVLVRPKTLAFDGEVYEVLADELIGTAVPFREAVHLVSTPLRSGSLVLLERGERNGLTLLPFVRMRVGEPAATACYFYSRLNADGARFVSFHQAHDSEVVEEDSALRELVDDLSGPR